MVESWASVTIFTFCVCECVSCMYVCVPYARLQLSEARNSTGSLELKLEALLKLRDLPVTLEL